MPRRIRGLEEQPPVRLLALVELLASELRDRHESGQPVIEEQRFPTGLIRVTVVWDDWDRVLQEDRAEIILRAYELAEGKEARDRIALAIGWTVPEAHASGMLPFQIIPAVRKGDSVTLEQCRAAMVAEGASILIDPNNPQLRSTTEKEAEDCKNRLIERLPRSEPVWVITKEVGRVDDWASSPVP